MTAPIKKILVSITLSGLIHSLSFAQSSPAVPFQGKIGKTTQETQQWWPEKKNAPQGAPNVIWILLDDIGFGASSAFGGLLETPNIDKLANEGIRFNNFHTSSICTPTRASLLTGRNAHAVHFGNHVHGSSYGTPGYDGFLPFETGTIAEVLRENGYNTFAVGKYHLTHPEEATPAGPFNRWPTNRGFDHYYGMSPATSSTDSYNGVNYEDTHVAPDDNRHLTTRITDKAIEYIAGQKSIEPDKPFFLYYAPGAIHEPHQVDKEWSDKYKGKFDEGWDKYREKVLANQIKAGIIPKGTKLPPQNPGVKEWNSLSADEKRLFARYMEVYAGMTTHTDYEIGRIINFLKDADQLDNTLIFLLIGDNGASAEGDEIGKQNPTDPTLSKEALFQKALKSIDSLGGQYSKVNYPHGWASAINTPFRFWKYHPNSEGGTRNPLIVYYPKGIKDKGTLRNQYTYLTDILPTTLELTNTVAPEKINGYPQTAFNGTSFASLLEAKNKNAPTKHPIQYYEITGSRAIYKDGWKAAVYHQKGKEFSQEVWTLYNLNEDLTEVNDLAAKHPDKLKELQDLFEAEATKNNVYPLKDAWVVERKHPFSKKNHIVLYPGLTTLEDISAPDFRTYNQYSIKADVELKNNSEGILLSFGGWASGISLYVKNQKLHFAYNVDGKITEIESSSTITPGEKTELSVDVNYNAETKTRIISLFQNNIKIGEQNLGDVRNVGRNHEGLEIGKDLKTPVSNQYKIPFAYTNKLRKVTIDIK